MSGLVKDICHMLSRVSRVLRDISSHVILIIRVPSRYQPELQRRFFEDFGGGPFWIHDFVATFGVNGRPIYMESCSKLVWGGLLETGSRPSVVDD